MNERVVYACRCEELVYDHVRRVYRTCDEIATDFIGRPDGTGNFYCSTHRIGRRPESKSP